MTTRTKILIAGSVLLSGVVLVLIGPRLLFDWAVTRSITEQGIRVQAVKPLFDTVVTSRLKVGDTLEHAKEVLSYAGLDYSIAKEPLPHELQSTYRAGDGSGFYVKLTLSRDDRITKVEIHDFYTGP